eukprot:4918889-Heterocapsa_arctica.AAC.1
MQLKAVHMGEPISNCGFSLLTLSMALSRCRILSKSHGFPNSSEAVRSKAKPGWMPNPGLLLAA